MVEQIAIRGFDKNFTYFLHNGKGGKSIAIVDPGDSEQLIAEINLKGWIPKMILITHSHFDHTEGVERLVEEYKIPIYIHKNIKDDIKVNRLDDNDEILLDDVKIKVLYTPGHSIDSVCYFIDETQANDGIPKLFTGDTLFIDACGRADLPGSDVKELYESLKRIKTLPDETIIYPGHDYGEKPYATLGQQKRTNKYLMCNDFYSFRKIRLP
ncbi:MBL fold metallo-hydrolase [Candidatus Peregrinibacteria bacterium]|nr:MBL fold metallo-hydrolase [Candidatus Peregrinibacteria bacterium]